MAYFRTVIKLGQNETKKTEWQSVYNMYGNSATLSGELHSII